MSKQVPRWHLIDPLRPAHVMCGRGWVRRATNMAEVIDCKGCLKALEARKAFAVLLVEVA